MVHSKIKNKGDKPDQIMGDAVEHLTNTKQKQSNAIHNRMHVNDIMVRIVDHFGLTVSDSALSQEIAAASINSKSRPMVSAGSQAVNRTGDPPTGFITDGAPEIIWPKSALPPTKYTTARTPKAISRAEDILRMELKTLRPKELARLLHIVDILMVKAISAEDLIAYDGSNIPRSIAHLRNKNTGVFNWLSAEADFRYLERVMKAAVHYKNCNLLNLAIGAAQRQKLKKSHLKRLVFYRELIERTGSGILPFEGLLKDCADSNVNVMSEVASMRFCKIITYLEGIKRLEPPGNIRESRKQYVYGKAWAYLNQAIHEEVIPDPLEGMHLLF